MYILIVMEGLDVLNVRGFARKDDALRAFDITSYENKCLYVPPTENGIIMFGYDSSKMVNDIFYQNDPENLIAFAGDDVVCVQLFHVNFDQE